MRISEQVVEELRQKDCEEVATLLGLKVYRHKAFCFLHNESIPSLSFNPRKRNMWKCFSCNKGGNAINLVMQHENMDFISACSWLCDAYGIRQYSQPCHNVYKKGAHKVSCSNFAYKEDNDKSFDKEIGEWLIKNLKIGDVAIQFLLVERKLKPEVPIALNIRSIDDSREVKDKLLATFGVKRCQESGLFNERGNLCLWTPCLLFPYYDENKELIGLQSRYLGDNTQAPRFQFLSKEKTHLFNMQIFGQLKQGEKLFITEGVTDCLAMLANGLNAVAIPSATIIPEEDLYMLDNFVLSMIPDNDEAGYNGFVKLRSSLNKKGISLSREYIPESYKDYADYYKHSRNQVIDYEIF